VKQTRVRVVRDRLRHLAASSQLESARRLLMFLLELQENMGDDGVRRGTD
jgi:hypothetical protein